MLKISIKKSSRLSGFYYIFRLAGRTLHIFTNAFESVPTVFTYIVFNRQISFHIQIKRVSNTTHHCHLTVLSRGSVIIIIPTYYYSYFSN
ncbi:hypothetical protein MSBR2_0296 [Methanosarcina barkeri 227]|uniref:Uncharacterized protein n=2 Tax=Methanosarcina barkeri TaxID=2208 RepID=A0A0E3QUZ9_METBA|nr:hypothetical protein MSBRM_2111 [Methanosarcina barkeri MS]AKB56812.1 hypothetical protein MSBR2_0296 [Methanosarcina barkeri 227]